MEYLRDVEGAAEAFPWMDEPICLVGHTHVPACFAVHRSASEARVDPSDVSDCIRPQGGEPRVPGASLPFTDSPAIVDLSAGSQFIINPGSVGQPRDRDPRASFAILDLGRGAVEFHRVAYDIAEAMRRAGRAGLPGILGERLAVGA